MLDPDVGFYGATRDETSLIAVYEDSYDSGAGARGLVPTVSCRNLGG